MADLCATPRCVQLQLAQAVDIHNNVERVPTGPNPLASLFNKDVLKAAKEKIESDISDFKSKIHRFPANLRGFGRDRDYISPWIVAIGPYYHGVRELQAMEEVKRMAVYCFCEGLADTPEEVYKKIFPVACEVRGCYADADALKGITDDDFAAMMFFDGCFLVHCMFAFNAEPSLMTEVIESNDPSNIKRDIMLLENQIPWPVIQLLTALRPVPIRDFIDHTTSRFHVRWRLKRDEVNIDKDFKPPHLLGLIHFYLVRSSFIEKESRRALLHKLLEKTGAKELPLTTSAAELAEIGVKLTSSGTTQFSDMKFVKGLVCGVLSLAPLLLGDLNGCQLVNMAAFEQCTRTPGKNVNHRVNSYLSVLALLMNRDDDVRELRGKGVVHTNFNYHQTLNFFERLAPQLIKDDSYYVVLQGLEEYKQRRRVCIAIHKFLYKNRSIIATVLSIAGVLVGIFKALFSLKQHQP